MMFDICGRLTTEVFAELVLDRQRSESPAERQLAWDQATLYWFYMNDGERAELSTEARDAYLQWLHQRSLDSQVAYWEPVAREMDLEAQRG